MELKCKVLHCWPVDKFHLDTNFHTWLIIWVLHGVTSTLIWLYECKRSFFFKRSLFREKKKKHPPGTHSSPSQRCLRFISLSALKALLLPSPSVFLALPVFSPSFNTAAICSLFLPTYLIPLRPVFVCCLRLFSCPESENTFGATDRWSVSCDELTRGSRVLRWSLIHWSVKPLLPLKAGPPRFSLL